MADPMYSASLSQTQGRSGFSIIFRHPARRDHASGKPGVRVRRGLGTRDEAEAERLRDELNVILGDPCESAGKVTPGRRSKRPPYPGL